jgi:hypothetical protein
LEVTVPDFDPITLLMQYTAEGFYSEILYDKRDGVLPAPRVVEPRVLCDGIDGLLVRCHQVEPTKGTKCFKVQQITGVRKHWQELPPAVRKQNRFCSGEVLESPAPKRSVNGALTATIRLDECGGLGLLRDPRFIAYIAELRIALLDGQVTTQEAARLESERARIGMNEEHMRAAHTYLLAEEMLAAALDGTLFDRESDHLRETNRCLAAAGWSPMPTLETPW